MSNIDGPDRLGWETLDPIVKNNLLWVRELLREEVQPLCNGLDSLADIHAKSWNAFQSQYNEQETNYRHLVKEYERLQGGIEKLDNHLHVLKAYTEGAIDPIHNMQDRIESLINGLGDTIVDMKQRNGQVEKLIFEMVNGQQQIRGDVQKLQKAQNKVLLYLISQLSVGANIDPMGSTEEQAKGIEEEVDDLSEIFG